jgi:hypothetical protein
MNENEIKIFPDDGQPRISSRALARMLGISHEELVRLIERHRNELLSYGPLVQLPIQEREENQ